MITSVLTGLVFWWLFFTAIPSPLLLLLSVGLGLLFLRTKHQDSLFDIDRLARRSALSPINPALKVWSSVILLLLCIAANAPWAPLILSIVLCLLTVCVGQIPFHDYISKFSLPAVFLLLSAMALLWSFVPQAGGCIDIPCFGGYLSVLPSAQQAARLVLARALGAVSCLYFLSLSTPMPEIIAVLRQAHVPRVMTDLAILIYRYIFLLFDTYDKMYHAAESRLGFCGLRRSLSTTGQLYALLLSGSFRKASACFDAMESRCYDCEIRFLTHKKPITLKSAGAACLLILFAASMTLSSFL